MADTRYSQFSTGTSVQWNNSSYPSSSHYGSHQGYSGHGHYHSHSTSSQASYDGPDVQYASYYGSSPVSSSSSTSPTSPAHAVSPTDSDGSYSSRYASHSSRTQSSRPHHSRQYSPSYTYSSSHEHPHPYSRPRSQSQGYNDHSPSHDEISQAPGYHQQIPVPPAMPLTPVAYPAVPQRPFACDLCALSFNRQHDLKRHRETHTGEKPFLCNGGCNKTFTRKDALKRHQVRLTRPFTTKQGADDWVW